jgi:putative nucleotidyltransferase with HDIG domain
MTVAAILSVVFIVVTVDARDRVRRAETERLRVSGRVFSALEARLQKGELATIVALAENPTLKAALDTYITESRFGGLSPEQEHALRRTVTQEAESLAAVTEADVLAVLDADGRVYASAGTLRDYWPLGHRPDLGPRTEPTFQTVVALPTRAFRVSGTSLTLGDRDVGTLAFARALDADYARELSALSRAGIVIAVDGEVTATTVSEAVTRALVDDSADTGETRSLAGEEYAVATLLASGPARIYTLSSIDAAARQATREALAALGTIALGAFVLAAFGSFWLARTLSNPIDRLSTAIVTLKNAPESRRALQPTGTSRELDALATSFNGLMRDLQLAEAETQATYVGAIRALAAALDARDPYTAGHSQRVSALSVSIARQLSLEEAAVDVIRLGALLHDIGKIGIPDEVLRKPGALSQEEYEQIKRHPLLGARILRQVGFLAPHLPIVELHHERPDGKGYPYGLRAADIPLAAHIVHVADAFDAMTSGRAYKPARPSSFALAELRRGAGSEFDPACVDALCAATPSSAASEPRLEELLGRGAEVVA